jgi:hypothetical protein
MEITGPTISKNLNQQADIYRMKLFDLNGKKSLSVDVRDALARLWQKDSQLQQRAWCTNIFTTVSDMFPGKTVAAKVSMGGMAGGLGGILISKSAGYLSDYYASIQSI